MDILTLLLILGTGIFSASFGTLVGGGSLIKIPLLIFLGLPPHVAIGTNRFATIGVTGAGLYKFNQKKLINYKIGFLIAIPFFFASIIGANLVLQLNEAILKNAIAIITGLIVVFMLIRPKVGIKKTKKIIKKREYLITVILTFIIGIYAGFYGAGSGTFMTYLLVLLLGQTFLQAAATRKVAYLFSTTATIIIFALNGVIDYVPGTFLLVGNFIGSYLGAHYSDKIGNIWIRRMFFVLVLIMVVRLLI